MVRLVIAPMIGVHVLALGVRARIDPMADAAGMGLTRRRHETPMRAVTVVRTGLGSDIAQPERSVGHHCARRNK